MMPASNRGAGMNVGFPDVCLTPAAPSPIPVPYPNMAMNVQAASFSPTVKVTFMPALNMGSKIPMSTGDEGGTAHPMFKTVGAYTMGNPIVLVSKLPAVNLLCPTTGNNMNNPLGAVLVPSVTNVFYTLAECESATAEIGPAALAALDGAVRDVESEPAVRFCEAHSTTVVLHVARIVSTLSSLVFNALESSARLRAANGAGRSGAPLASPLILDLRGCPGGDAFAALSLADDFLPRGAELATIVEGDDERVLRARKGDPYLFPLAILVDGKTASAAELFAGCLAAHGRALVVGERTFGKLTAQKVAATARGGRYETVAHFRLPGAIETTPFSGLVPHITVPEMPGAGFVGVGDPALGAALSALC